jgi:predicted RNA-binding protein (virulence factor B family)
MNLDAVNLDAGTTVELEVAREVSPHGYFLTDGDTDVLLHYNETEGEFELGDRIEVFLFHDSENRLSATMKKSFIHYGEVALLEVADMNLRLGLFLEMGFGRQLLLPNAELPELEELRPKVGDKVYVRLDRDKQDRMIARAAGERDFEPLVFKAPDIWKNQWFEGTVYKPLQMGTFVLVEGGILGFGVMGLIHETERTQLLRMGERVKVRVTFVREDGRINCSMKAAKEIGRDEDAQQILSYLQERPNGAMPYSDETPADIIKDKFNVSKSAFKRALGKLMKENLIDQKGSWTNLKTDVNQEGNPLDNQNGNQLSKQDNKTVEE